MSKHKQFYLKNLLVSFYVKTKIVANRLQQDDEILGFYCKLHPWMRHFPRFDKRIPKLKLYFSLTISANPVYHSHLPLPLTNTKHSQTLSNPTHSVYAVFPQFLSPIFFNRRELCWLIKGPNVAHRSYRSLFIIVSISHQWSHLTRS